MRSVAPTAGGAEAGAGEECHRTRGRDDTKVHVVRGDIDVAGADCIHGQGGDSSSVGDESDEVCRNAR